MPESVPIEKKVEVLNRILGTVKSFKNPQVVTWILSFGLIANFSHFLRQKVGYFPHAIIIGKQKTGKTTLTVLNQYLYYGSNPLPPIKPKTETQLRHLLSQTTLLIPLEEWTELSSKNDQVQEMLNLLHSSAQRFVLKKITTSNPDINGVFLSLSSVLADTNFSQSVDISSLDKIIFVKLDDEEGIDIKKAIENKALLKNELKSNYKLHDVLHSIGLELLQIVSEKLKTFDFNKERAELLNDLIFLGYQSWIDLFRKYNIKLTPNAQLIYDEFPVPLLNTIETETDEDLDLLFSEFLHEKTKEIVKSGDYVPDSKNGLLKYGFYFESSDIVICSYGLLSEFKNWLIKEKGFNDRSMIRLVSDLKMKKSSITVENKTWNTWKKQLPISIN
ncbi:hypothetical protein [Saccharolobus islandicus]|uniref:hypothetical protein n=1 Tax=Saccharolobus islandicus TaxID=43080 RepID=UPI00035F9F7E|nr:hypothetical protein [Sulfolobus islandicus]